MISLHLHRWDVRPAEAREIQIELRERMERQDRIPKVEHVAGADIAFELPGRGSWRTGEGRAIAGVIVYRFPEYQELERASSVQPLRYPYVTGVHSFRKVHATLETSDMLWG